MLPWWDRIFLTASPRSMRCLIRASAVKTFYDIDTPITVRSLRQDAATDYLLPRHLPELDIYFSFTGGPLCCGKSKIDLALRRALPLYCSVDPERHQPLPPSPAFACDLSYMGTYAPDRQPKIDQLLCAPAAPCLATDSSWQDRNIQNQSRGRGMWRELLTSIPNIMRNFIASSRMTLNVTRREMVMAGFSPSVRLFEAAACGAAIVSDNWPGLETFFAPGQEILLPGDGRDVERYIVNYSER